MRVSPRDYPPLLSSREVATILGLSVRTVHKLILTGALPGYRMGDSHFKVTQPDLDAYLYQARVTDKRGSES